MSVVKDPIHYSSFNLTDLKFSLTCNHKSLLGQRVTPNSKALTKTMITSPPSPALDLQGT